jgi:hypothetical protein
MDDHMRKEDGYVLHPRACRVIVIDLRLLAVKRRARAGRAPLAQSPAAWPLLIKYGAIRRCGYRPGRRTFRAGDGNRTRAISLGIYRHHPEHAP